MAHLSTTHHVDDAGLALLREPRSDLVAESVVGTDEFGLLEGPFDHYVRRLEVRTVELDSHEVTEQFDYQTAVPVWGWLLAWPLRRALRRPPRDSMPWWSPPDRFDARAARVIALLCSLAVLAGYLGSLLSQTISPASTEFGATNTAEGFVLAATRAGVVIAIGATFIADRHGRRPVLLVTAAGACVIAITTAAAPNLLAYGTSQTFSRGLSTAMALLIGVVAAEETPARSRAYVVSILALCGGLGSGMVVWFLPLADISVRAWRLLFLFPILGLGLLALVARSLPETQRFEVSETAPRQPFARNRLILLAATAFFASAIAAPASNFMNDFLREERGFNNSQVSLFQLVVNTPIGIGVLIGGRLADTRGRRIVGATAFVVGSLSVAARYSASGATMWIVATIGTIIGAAAIPALGVYSFELFGTSRRAQSNGLLTLAGVTGSALGLIYVGWASDRIGFGPTFQTLLFAPAIVGLLIITKYPETAGMELEEINPEDRANPQARPPPGNEIGLDTSNRDRLS